MRGHENGSQVAHRLKPCLPHHCHLRRNPRAVKWKSLLWLPRISAEIKPLPRTRTHQDGQSVTPRLPGVERAPGCGTFQRSTICMYHCGYDSARVVIQPHLRFRNTIAGVSSRVTAPTCMQHFPPPSIVQRSATAKRCSRGPDSECNSSLQR